MKAGEYSAESWGRSRAELSVFDLLLSAPTPAGSGAPPPVGAQA